VKPRPNPTLHALSLFPSLSTVLKNLLSSLLSSLQPDGGVKKTITHAGVGFDTPETGDEVSVHYVGTLLDGSTFDSSRERGTPFVFTLGKGQVIKGWDVGVATMTKGQTAVLECAPEYAYGAAGSPPKIPANATLKFEVELLSWKSVKDVAGDGGVIKEAVSEGGGWKTPTDKDEVRAKFCLKVVEGTGEGAGLSSPAGGEEEAVFELGAAPARGLAVALRTMKKGEVASLTLKPPYTLPAGAPESAAGPTLAGTLTLTSWASVEAVTPDGGVVKKMVVDSESWSKATPGSKVVLKLTATALPDGPDGPPAPAPYLTADAFEFTVDEGEDAGVPEGLDLAVRSLAEGDRALVTATGARYVGHDVPGNPPAVRWDVTLTSLTKAKEAWEMGDDEKVEAATAAKAGGNDKFKAGAWEAAIKKYKRALSLVEYDTGFGPGAKAAAGDLKKAVNLNLAAAHLKIGDWKAAGAAADAVLAKDGLNGKALYRRAQARLGTQDYVEAERDVRAALDADPASRDARALLARIKKEGAAADKKERARYANMFDRLARLEAKEAKQGGGEEVAAMEADVPAAPAVGVAAVPEVETV